ncbi:MAG TPA: hypothetical protein VK731_06280, partial [Candidatus Cybelea sp.]|nr:hypothetical protein [Candidatus Cybelea sp.]
MLDGDKQLEIQPKAASRYACRRNPRRKRDLKLYGLDARLAGGRKSPKMIVRQSSGDFNRSKGNSLRASVPLNFNGFP